MERVAPQPGANAVAALSLAGLAGLAWLYLWHDASSMDRHGAVTLLMWTVMMTGMMLPSATPAALLYGTLARKHTARGNALPSVWVFVAGYLVVWTTFSALAAVLQVGLSQAALLTPMMASASKPLTGALLLAAGVYQFTPLKNACLAKCREPLPFFLAHWRAGACGSLRMGVAHGTYCVGCCAGLMLVLFAVGVMNLLWVAVVAGLVLIEKLLPAGRLTARFAGAALMAAGLAVLAPAGWI